jgi:hypothetical protein
MKEMQTVKVGMTRKDLLRVFVIEGGLSTGLRRTYAYRNCPSRPYLDWAVMD